MRNLLLIFAIGAISVAQAQVKPSKSNATFDLGTGLNFEFNDSNYRFKISGNVQPYMAFQKQKSAEKPEYIFNAKRTYFNLSGFAVKEKVSFFLQTDYSRDIPLMDAWIAYHGIKNLTITAGQKQNVANNREMLIMEDQLQFPDRSILSSQFSNTGREFGLFLDYKWDKNSFGIQSFVSVTSGDGRNSFGASASDVDAGGLKYSARLDIYPLGFFKEGNDRSMADLKREESVKIVLGGAASYNDGANETVGEGHNEFTLYNQVGETQQPDYRQVYFDVLCKYQGFSFLGEYVIASATNLEGTYTDALGELMKPTEISNYLALGSAYNLQAGYVTKKGYALDVRYTMTTPEFDQNKFSIIQENTAWGIGASKYFRENSLKIQAALTSFEYQNSENNKLLGELLLQVIF